MHVKVQPRSRQCLIVAIKLFYWVEEYIIVFSELFLNLLPILHP